MKQIINKEDKAVSPIIATILLIAITVVLAATLYTVLGGFTSGLSTSGSATLSANFTNSTSSSPSNYAYSISVSSSSNGGISITSLEVKITNANGSFTSTPFDSSGQLKLYNNNYTVTTSGLSSGKVVAGTTISISTTNAKNPLYGALAISQVSIIDTASNSVIWTS